MEILFFRHGNTFEQGETPYFVGAGEDLALSTRGTEQALEAAAALKTLGWLPGRIVSSPLVRCLSFAELITEELGSPALSVEAENLLTELDYGDWAGKTDSEVEQEFGSEALEAWRKRAEFPKNASFPEDLEAVLARLKSFLDKALVQFEPNSKTVVVSSNGVLRFLPMLIEANWESMRDAGELKVGTGRLILIKRADMKPETKWELSAWNVLPLEWRLSPDEAKRLKAIGALGENEGRENNTSLRKSGFSA